MKCKTCGIHYIPSIAEDRRHHDFFHKKALLLIEKIGHLKFHSEREAIKYENSLILHNKQLPFHDRIEAAIKIIDALFHRSMEFNNFSLEHVDFSDYSAMFLLANRKSTWFAKNSEIYNALVSKFGTKKGIIKGSSYFLVPAGSYQ